MNPEEFDILQPDKYKLDEEWVKQPKVFFDFALRLEKPKRKVAETSAALDIERAELDKAIRSNPAKFGIGEKITETVIAQTILLIASYQEKQNLLITYKYKQGVMQAAVNAMEHRKSALERLVSLQGQNYFATPKALSGSEDVVDKIEKRNIRRKSVSNVSKPFREGMTC